MTTLWEDMLQEFVKEYEKSPTDFLRQPTISKTVHPNCQALANEYYNEMMKSSFFKESILPGIQDSSIGNPFQFSVLPKCSPLSIQHAYHLNLIKERLGIFIPKEEISHIVEIGGGYGNLCRLVKNFGYEGRYIIVDFPEMLKIQQDYLFQNSIDNVEFLPLNMKQLLPKENTDTSILIATFSVNEMPMETRTSMEPYYTYYDYLFFAHNTFFDGINNIEYFSSLRSFLEPNFKIEYFKDKFKSSWFMLGKNKELTK